MKQTALIFHLAANIKLGITKITANCFTQNVFSFKYVPHGKYPRIKQTEIIHSHKHWDATDLGKGTQYRNSQLFSLLLNTFPISLTYTQRERV